MITVDETTFTNEKMAFFKKHDFDFQLTTTDQENNKYLKTYCFEDGAVWYELMGKVEELAEVTVHNITVHTTVTLAKTEYWTSESGSKFFYERW